MRSRVAFAAMLLVLNEHLIRSGAFWGQEGSNAPFADLKDKLSSLKALEAEGLITKKERDECTHELLQQYMNRKPSSSVEGAVRAISDVQTAPIAIPPATNAPSATARTAVVVVTLWASPMCLKRRFASLAGVSNGIVLLDHKVQPALLPLGVKALLQPQRPAWASPKGM